MNEEVLELGGMNINDLGIIFKDLSARELIQEIINAITLNNSAIGSRINDLHNRLSNIELNYVTKTELTNTIGNLGNKVEAVEATYYTAEDDEVIAGTKQVGDIKTAAINAVPYTNVAEVIEDDKEIWSAAIADLNSKYESLNS